MTNLTAASPPASSSPPHAHPPTTACNDRPGTTVPKKKGKKWRQVKKPKTAPPPIEAVEHKRGHSRRRMQNYSAVTKKIQSRRQRVTAAMVKRALENIEVVDCELDQLRTARLTVNKAREYRHEELEALGIRTIHWNGR